MQVSEEEKAEKQGRRQLDWWVAADGTTSTKRQSYQCEKNWSSPPRVGLVNRQKLLLNACSQPLLASVSGCSYRINVTSAVLFLHSF